MANHTIISIGREFGSGGSEIGRRLAERLGIPLYNRNLIQMAARELGISGESAAEADETILDRFLSGYVVNMQDYTAYMGGDDEREPLSDQVFQTQSEIIRQLAGRGPCVVVGRCADYILRDLEDCISVFICADEEDRVSRVMEIGELSKEQAKEKIQKVDSARKLYYEAHTGCTWGGIKTHEMIFNSSLAGIDQVVDTLEAVYRNLNSGRDSR